MNPTTTLHAGPTPSAPALVLRPWRAEDVAALVEAFRDPALRHWAGTPVRDEADGARWVRAQQQGWEAGFRLCAPASTPPPPRPPGRRPCRSRRSAGGR
ncbi:GNAT family N-acetyltransferase [Streptomyces roseolus]|uniref:GNAT family N-acetyltransferase n=1 Tax=Streptomyces roseolus TaxID=67358 RepID=UPI00364302D2